MRSNLGIKGTLEVTVVGPDGNVKHHSKTNNIITSSGYVYYANLASPWVTPSYASDMRLGSGSAEPSATGAGSNLDTPIPGMKSHELVISVITSGDYPVITYSGYFPPNLISESTSATEVVLTFGDSENDKPDDSQVISRALLDNIPLLEPVDEVNIVWEHELLSGSVM